MFTVDGREALLSELIEAGKGDGRITGVAITGSTSVGNEDRWSDIDLAFGVCDQSEVQAVLGEFTDRMYGPHGAVHHLDVHSGAWLYRVFLLESTLQVDLAFAPMTDFGPRGPTFKLVSGSAAADKPPIPGNAEDLIGWAWLYALHARSSIARQRFWQAEYMISGMRDQILALTCLRYGLPAHEARGVDLLPAGVTQPLETALVGCLQEGELCRALQAGTTSLLDEIGFIDEDLTARLLGPLTELGQPSGLA